MIFEKASNSCYTNATQENKKDIEGKKFNIMDVLTRQARKFFKFFMWKIIYLFAQKDLRNLKDENAYETLMKELQKPRLIETLYKGKKIMINLPEGKDVHMIATYLKMMPAVAKFLEFNLIDETNFQFACNNFVDKALKNNEELFESKSLYKNFVIVLKGKLLVKSVKNAVGYDYSITKNINEGNKNILKTKKTVQFEYEKEDHSEKIYNTGDYFSRKLRSSDRSTIYSALALEEVNAIFLDYKVFEVLFEKSIQKSEKQRKNFILKTIKTFETLGPSRFDAFFRVLEVNFLEYQQILYCEGEKAEKLHLIYSGSFEFLVKDFSKLNFIDKEEISRKRLHTILKLEKGDIVGLEALKEDGHYQQTMRSISEFAVVLSFNPYNIGSDAYERLIIFLNRFQDNKNKIIEDLISSNNTLQDKFKIKYKNEITRALLKTSTYKQLIIDQIQHKAEEILINSHRNNKKQTLLNSASGDFKNIRIKIKLKDTYTSNNPSNKAVNESCVNKLNSNHSKSKTLILINKQDIAYIVSPKNNKCSNNAQPIEQNMIKNKIVSKEEESHHMPNRCCSIAISGFSSNKKKNILNNDKYELYRPDSNFIDFEKNKNTTALNINSVRDIKEYYKSMITPPKCKIKNKDNQAEKVSNTPKTEKVNKSHFKSVQVEKNNKLISNKILFNAVLIRNEKNNKNENSKSFEKNNSNKKKVLSNLQIPNMKTEEKPRKSVSIYQLESINHIREFHNQAMAIGSEKKRRSSFNLYCEPMGAKIKEGSEFKKTIEQIHDIQEQIVNMENINHDLKDESLIKNISPVMNKDNNNNNKKKLFDFNLKKLPPKNNLHKDKEEGVPQDFLLEENQGINIQRNFQSSEFLSIINVNQEVKRKLKFCHRSISSVNYTTYKLPQKRTVLKKIMNYNSSNADKVFSSLKKFKGKIESNKFINKEKVNLRNSEDNNLDYSDMSKNSLAYYYHSHKNSDHQINHNLNLSRKDSQQNFSNVNRLHQKNHKYLFDENSETNSINHYNNFNNKPRNMQANSKHQSKEKTENVRYEDDTFTINNLNEDIALNKASASLKNFFNKNNLKNKEVNNEIKNLKSLMLLTRHENLIYSLDSFKEKKDCQTKKSIEDWIKINKHPTLNFNTGNFSIPLCIKMLNNNS